MRNTTIASGASKQATKTASSRGLSPVRSLSTSPTRRMPSPRPSPAIRPQSPLSPRYDSGRFEMLQPPSPRSMHARTTGNTQRRANTNSLKLPTLPRFHPANYPSAHSSVQSTPDAGNGSPQPPASPRAHQRVISDAQKHLLFYQRETVSASVRASSPSRLDGPRSPRLAPLGSPGPVTPLELEGDDGYLVAGARDIGNEASLSSDELVERLIGMEARRRRSSNSPSRPTAR